MSLRTVAKIPFPHIQPNSSLIDDLAVFSFLFLPPKSVFLLQSSKFVFFAFASIYYNVCFKVLFVNPRCADSSTPIFPNHYHPRAIPFRSCLHMLTRILSQTLCYQMGTYTVYKETGAFKFIGGLPRCLPLAFSTAILSA